jgi:hypothetical protein
MRFARGERRPVSASMATWPRRAWTPAADRKVAPTMGGLNRAILLLGGIALVAACLVLSYSVVVRYLLKRGGGGRVEGVAHATASASLSISAQEDDFAA